jgi:hypothetical protein
LDFGVSSEKAPSFAQHFGKPLFRASLGLPLDRAVFAALDAVSFSANTGSSVAEL